MATEKEKQEFWVEDVRATIKHAKEALKKFSASIQEDPVYALRWSTDAFKWAAVLDVYGSVLRALEKDTRLEAIYATVIREVRNAALFPARSTSPVSNLMEQEQGAAWARIEEGLRQLVGGK